MSRHVMKKRDSQVRLVNAKTPMEIEDKFTAMDSQLMNVRSFAKKTLGSI